MAHKITHQIRTTETPFTWRPAISCSCGHQAQGMIWAATGKARSKVWNAARDLGHQHREEVARQNNVEADPFFGI